MRGRPRRRRRRRHVEGARVEGGLAGGGRVGRVGVGRAGIGDGRQRGLAAVGSQELPLLHGAGVVGGVCRTIHFIRTTECLSLDNALFNTVLKGKRE